MRNDLFALGIILGVTALVLTGGIAWLRKDPTTEPQDPWIMGIMIVTGVPFLTSLPVIILFHTLQRDLSEAVPFATLGLLIVGGILIYFHDTVKVAVNSRSELGCIVTIVIQGLFGLFFLFFGCSMLVSAIQFFLEQPP